MFGQWRKNIIYDIMNVFELCRDSSNLSSECILNVHGEKLMRASIFKNWSTADSFMYVKKHLPILSCGIGQTLSNIRHYLHTLGHTHDILNIVY